MTATGLWSGNNRLILLTLINGTPAVPAFLPREGKAGRGGKKMQGASVAC